MNRRELIKNLGLGAGFLVVGPSAFGLLQSCKRGADLDWEPVFLSKSNGFILEKLLDVIIPSTETPGAGDLNLAQFIDIYMQEVATKEQQNAFRKGAEDFSKIFKQMYEKNISEATEEEYHEILTRFLKSAPGKSQKELKRTTETQDPLDKDPDMETKNGEGALSYLETVRELGIWGWKNSKVIGEEVLWYDPNPGMYVACGPMEELGNGRAMSL